MVRKGKVGVKGKGKGKGKGKAEVQQQPEPQLAVQPEPQLAVQPEPQFAVQPDIQPQPEAVQPGIQPQQGDEVCDVPSEESVCNSVCNRFVKALGYVSNHKFITFCAGLSLLIGFGILSRIRIFEYYSVCSDPFYDYDNNNCTTAKDSNNATYIAKCEEQRQFGINSASACAHLSQTIEVSGLILGGLTCIFAAIGCVVPRLLYEDFTAEEYRANEAIRNQKLSNEFDQRWNYELMKEKNEKPGSGLPSEEKELELGASEEFSVKIDNGISLGRRGLYFREDTPLLEVKAPTPVGSKGKQLSTISEVEETHTHSREASLSPTTFIAADDDSREASLSPTTFIAADDDSREASPISSVGHHRDTRASSKDCTPTPPTEPYLLRHPNRPGGCHHSPNQGRGGDCKLNNKQCIEIGPNQEPRKVPVNTLHGQQGVEEDSQLQPSENGKLCSSLVENHSTSCSCT